MNETKSERAVIFAPRGRDAKIASSILRESGIESEIANSIPELIKWLRKGSGFAIVTDESLNRADLRGIDAFVREQEEWSDFPFILIMERGGSVERNPAAQRHLELLGNVTFLERPFHPTTLISLAKAVLRGRRRQYDARERMLTMYDREQQLRIALSAGRLGAWTIDIATMTLEASDHCKRNFGRPPGTAFSYQDLLASVHPDDLERMQDAVKRTLEHGVDYDVEYRCIWPDGSTHWVQVRGRPKYNHSGEAVRLAGVSQDITERKSSEQTLRNFAAELEKRVEERTREREAVSAQLHEAQKLETLGQLTGGVAHDFNNLLTPIVGTLDMVRRRVDDARTQRLLDGALQASERARTLVARLLAFARRQNLEARPVDVAVLIEGIVDLIQRSIGPTISLEFISEAQDATALVDPNQLELALLNLAVNARDAMPEGGSLRLFARQAVAGDDTDGLKAGDYVIIEVSDTGSGMDAETLAKAVEPFFSTKGVGKGTGLGLSMVHGLAAQSGGALYLESVPGSGTKATLWLPAASRGQREMAPISEVWQVGTAGDLTVLLVDDEDLVREGTAAMLEGLGHNVTMARSGEEAVAFLHERSFDMLVTDFLMPRMSGLELAKITRRLQPKIPILMITGFADPTSENELAISKLAKPFNSRELALAIDKELGHL